MSGPTIFEKNLIIFFFIFPFKAGKNLGGKGTAAAAASDDTPF